MLNNFAHARALSNVIVCSTRTRANARYARANFQLPVHAEKVFFKH